MRLSNFPGELSKLLHNLQSENMKGMSFNKESLYVRTPMKTPQTVHQRTRTPIRTPETLQQRMVTQPKIQNLAELLISRSIGPILASPLTVNVRAEHLKLPKVRRQIQ